MELAFTIGSFIFAASSFYFLLARKKEFNSAFFVSIITLISYILMYEGSFAAGDIHWTRWLFYSFSCPLLITEFANQLKKSPPEKQSMIYTTVLVMVTGIFSAVFVDEVKWLFFAVSSFLYTYLLITIFTSKSKALNTLQLYIAFGWTMFPAVFLVATEGMALIGNDISQYLYLLLDIFTKIIFYLHLDHVKPAK